MGAPAASTIASPFPMWPFYGLPKGDQDVGRTMRAISNWGRPRRPCVPPGGLRFSATTPPTADEAQRIYQNFLDSEKPGVRPFGEWK